MVCPLSSNIAIKQFLTLIIQTYILAIFFCLFCLQLIFFFFGVVVLLAIFLLGFNLGICCNLDIGRPGKKVDILYLWIVLF